MLEEVKQIVEGWKNLIFPNPVSEEMGKKRATICVLCMHYNKETKRCRVCHCFTPAAVRSSDKKCPKGKW